MEGEHEKIPQEENRLELIKQTIENSRSAIEREYAETANDWLSCFGSRVFVVETYLSSRKCQELMSPDEYANALGRIEQVKERLYELRDQYSAKEQQPPDEIKEELLAMLNIFET